MADLDDIAKKVREDAALAAAEADDAAGNAFRDYMLEHSQAAIDAAMEPVRKRAREAYREVWGRVYAEALDNLSAPFPEQFSIVDARKIMDDDLSPSKRHRLAQMMEHFLEQDRTKGK